ncbi:IS3 family transposase, partial [Neobacillus mesonae]|uniref:IS3 family transposase n=1 Tax=Neobacillus mesonae TaxID=1193713 RepID=UPI0020400CAF
MPKKTKSLNAGTRKYRQKQAQVVTELRQKYSLSEILEVVDLPKSVYYYYQNHEEFQRNDQELIKEMKEIKKENPAYGYRRLTLELHNRGWKVNHKRVQRITQEQHLQSLAYRKKNRKYNSYKGTVGKIAPNRLHRRFNTDRPYQKLTVDVTELRWGDMTTEHRCYLEPVMDLYSGEILAFNIDLHPTVNFALKPLHKALESLPKLPYRTTVHSDQGFQYQHHSWVKELKEHHVFQSMSRKANCLDNAAMESFFHLLKCEKIYHHDYKSFEDVA